MKKLFLGLLLGAAVSSAHAADSSAPSSSDASSATSAPDVKASAPDRYTVVKGDTLWGIAGRYLQDPWRWPEIWQANKQIANPHLIYPGDQIILCHIHGQAVMALDDGGGCASVAARMNAPASSSSDSAMRDVRKQPQIRSEHLEVAVPTIPLQLIRAYLNDSRVVSYDTLKNAPHVIGADEGHIVTGAGDEIYARGDFTGPSNDYGIYRSGQVYLDPETGEVLGYEATSIGNGKVTGLERGVATIKVINTQDQDVRTLDKLLPKEERMVTAVFEPRAPRGVKPGRIVRIFDTIDTAATNNIIVINRGERDGVRQGDTFSTYEHSRLIRDQANDDVVRLPTKTNGLAMVFRTFDRVSYAIILRASNVIRLGDDLRSPTAN